MVIWVMVFTGWGLEVRDGGTGWTYIFIFLIVPFFAYADSHPGRFGLESVFVVCIIPSILSSQDLPWLRSLGKLTPLAHACSLNSCVSNREEYQKSVEVGGSGVGYWIK